MKKPVLSRKGLIKWTVETLHKYSIKPLKKHSQSFVVDPVIIRDFLKRIDWSLATIEIGAGLGTLSYYLIDCCRKNVLLYEIDSRLVNVLKEVVSKPNSIVIHSDALLHEWIAEQIVSNTPYHITSNILVKLTRSNCVKKAVLVLQKDVVNRLVSKPGTREYGRITILVNTVFKLETGPVYPPRSFYPSPEVSSQMIVMERARIYNSDIAFLEQVTRRLFSKRRKKISKVLYEEYGLTETTILSIGLNPDLRVYELDIGDVLRIAEIVKNYV